MNIINKNNMEKKIFQSGGSIIDEDELFEDGVGQQGQGTSSGGALDGELVGGQRDTDPATTDYIEPAGYVAPDDGFDLTGVEQFLTAYGVQGGVITYEDGSSARFSELDYSEQAEILSSLVSESLPSIEEKYNLDDDEVNLLNTLRDSDMTSEEFINSLVDYRMQAVSAQRELSTTDYEAVSDDGIFVKSLRDSYPEITDEEIAEELFKAKELSSYATTTEAMRQLFMTHQAEDNYYMQEENDKVFSEQLEAQRHSIVETVEDINDIGGANISSEMKEYLLHDIMELNDNRDPILMEKLFGSPEAMFKANWFLNYGESYMTETNTYWRNEVSKARKEGYMQATNGMPGNPVNIAGVNRNGQRTAQGNQTYGKELTEEELFEGAE
jgi:hypothetical protein